MSVGYTLNSASMSGRLERDSSETFVLFSIIGFTCYQFALCIINANIASINNGIVAATELLLLGAVFYYIFPTLKPRDFLIVFGLALYFLALSCFRGAVEVSGPRNLAIIFLAYSLGRHFGDRESANRLVWSISIIVIAVGSIEYFFTEQYFKICNVLRYYVARGEVNQAVTAWVKQDSFVSSVRMSGRNLFPFLGDLRVSSVFLEPVSMGNYATIVCAWALSYDFSQWRKALPHFAVGLLLIVACDSRFASLLVVFLVLVRLVPFLSSRGVLFLMPFLVTVSLLVFTLLEMGNPFDDNLTGRLMRSGQAVADMSFGRFAGYEFPEPLFDMGIAYSIENYGVLLCVALWALFSWNKAPCSASSRFRILFAVYALGILLVSGNSLFSSKTAVLGWYLVASVTVRRDYHYTLARSPISVEVR